MSDLTVNLTCDMKTHGKVHLLEILVSDFPTKHGRQLPFKTFALF